MRKIFITAVILTAGLWAMSFKGYCELEGEKTHKAALPVVEALAAYAERNGIPNFDSFEQIKGIPYELKPCSERPDLMECEGMEDGYFFQLDNEYYSIALWGGERNSKLVTFGLFIAHNYSTCSYEIYDMEKVKTDYMQKSCSLSGKCAGWFRQ